MKDRIKVTIIDDDLSYRELLKTVLAKEKRIHLYSEYDSGQSFLKSLHSPFQPDVCLVDVMLQDMSGFECCRMIKEKKLDIRLIIMTAYPNAQSLGEARKLGADYIEKGPRIKTFINHIITSMSVSDKEVFISLQNTDPSKIDYLMLANELEKAKSLMSTLSEMQLKVVKLKNMGKTEIEIADILDLSSGTVHTHFNRAMQKLKLPNVLAYLLEQ